MKSGFVALLGLPNVGKSSLLNRLVKQDIAITSNKAQTTRNSILGICKRGDDEIVFIDTPGIHKAKTALGQTMNKEAYGQAEGADVIYYLVDAKRGLSTKDEDILKRLFKLDIPVFLILNKIDLIGKDMIAKLLMDAREQPFKELIPISVLNDENIDELLKTTVNYFKDDIKYFPDEMVTNTSLEFRAKEIIRQKVLTYCDEEVPHLVATDIDLLNIEDNKVYIEATIICNRESHKAIIIGKKGERLKKINMSASKDLKKLFGRKVYLSLFVKVKEDWMNKPGILKDLGYGNYE